MKKLYIFSLAMLAFVACSTDDGNDGGSSSEPKVSYETISFESCEIPSTSNTNIPAEGAESVYEEFGAEFSCTNHLYELSGVWVANKSEKSDWDQEYSGIPSDRYVICNVEPAFVGADDTAQYSVWTYTPNNSSVVPQMAFGAGVEKKIVSAKVNNVAKYWHCMKVGYYSKPAFADGDYYEVIFNGYNAAGEVTGTVPVIMADFRDGKSFIMESWTEVDLSALGEVNKVVLTATPSPALSSILYGDYYSICVDEIKFEVPAE